jgi:hypothetical protein
VLELQPGRASSTAVSLTSIQLIAPPNSHVARKPIGGSHRSIVPLALPPRWNLPPTRSSPETGKNQRGTRSGFVHASGP